MSDEQQLERLEKKVDDGFAGMRADSRAFRAEMSAMHRMIIQLFVGLFATIIFGFAGIITAALIQF